MAYSWLFIVDPSTFLMIGCAVCTILYGSYRSLSLYQTSEEEKRKDGNQNQDTDVKLKTAIILPIIGSIALVLLFYFLKKIYYLLLVILSLSAVNGISFVVYPLFDRLARRFNFERTWEVKWLGTVYLSALLSLLFSIPVVSLWIAFRTHPSVFFLTDILALSLAITALSSVRLPNLMISTVILTLFFLYDIFWVFLSQYIFSKNVMVTVATGLPDLPMVITFPRMLDDGESLLGLGDIVLPGLFLCFLYRFDHFNKIKFAQGYFLRAWIGYTIGLIITMIMVWALQRGQPALLYLVPCTLLTTVCFGWKRKQLTDLWKGLYTISSEEELSNVNVISTVPTDSEPSLKEDEVSLLQAAN